MWPFNKLPPRARKLLAAVSIAATIFSSLNSARAASKSTENSWNRVEKAHEAYKKAKTDEKKDILIKALENLIVNLEQDAKKLPEDSKERADVEAEIEKMQRILDALSATEVSEESLPPEVVAVVNSEAHRMINQEYNAENPLGVEINKTAIELLSPQELNQIYSVVKEVKKPSLRKQQARSMINSKIIHKKEVLEKVREAKKK